MLFQEMKHEELQQIISCLDQAIYSHEEWFNSLVRILICRLSPDKHDMTDEPHKECRFGQWYYSENIQKLNEHMGFKAIGDAHIQMHQLARSLLGKTNLNQTITPPEYDGFANSLQHLRLQITNLKRELETLVYNRDPLTGAITRVSLLPALREQQELAKRSNQRCFIVMMDVDHFKDVNDQKGHSTGDAVLTALAHLINETLGPSDKIFRYGGEEFLIYLGNIESDPAYKKVEDLRKKIAETDIVTSPEALRVTVSFGITPLDLDSSVEESIDRADKALLAAKESGRNCTQFWNK